MLTFQKEKSLDEALICKTRNSSIQSRRSDKQNLKYSNYPYPLRGAPHQSWPAGSVRLNIATVSIWNLQILLSNAIRAYKPTVGESFPAWNLWIRCSRKRSWKRIPFKRQPFTAWQASQQLLPSFNLWADLLWKTSGNFSGNCQTAVELRCELGRSLRTRRSTACSR